MACDCMKKVDEAMAERGATRLYNAMIFDQKANTLGLLNRVQIVTYLADSKKRGEKAAGITAAYCPFCGTDYKEEKAP